jgi:hypothetical protein
MRDEKDGFVLGLWAASVALGAIGCQAADVSDLFAFRGAPVMDDLMIRTVDGRYFQGDPARIEIVAPLPAGPSAVASISISTADHSGHGLSVAFDVHPGKLLEHAFTVEIGAFPEGGTIAQLSSKGAELVDSGTLQLNTSNGRISGQFRTAEATLASGTIDGRYELACLVPPEMLGLPPNGETSPGTWILVEDEAKKSEFCKPFREF